MSNTDGNRNNKHLTFSDAKSHCANVGRLANATLRHYSESSEHSRNSLGRRSTCYLHRIKTLINVFNSCSSGVPAETRELPEDSLYSLSNKRLSHSTVSDKLSMVVGFPTLVREYSKCFKNSQPFAVTGISSTCHVRILNFRLCTLGVPVSNSDSREASQNSLTF